MSRNLLCVLVIGILSASGPLVTVRGVEAGQFAVAHFEKGTDGFRYRLPPRVRHKGLRFARERIPVSRPDVSRRILRELNYLLFDRRSRVLLWLVRADAIKPVVYPILRRYGAPSEIIYLAAIESSYNSRALSSAGAFGYWQFIKSTAVCGPKGCDEYDWKMDITGWKDERADLIHSTHSAARYLCWMNRIRKVRLDGQPERDGFRDWLLSAAAYNAGPSRVVKLLNTFGARSYWDVPLPAETEKYVPRWIALGLISRYRTYYGVKAEKGPALSFQTVRRLKLRKDLTFRDMARLLDITPRQVWLINTQISPQRAVFPAKWHGRRLLHTINVPMGKKKQFLAQLEAKGYTGK